MTDHPPTDHPHGDAPVLRRGAEASDADAALLLLHGRGAGAGDMAPLAEALVEPLAEGTRSRVAHVMPQASGDQWYPQRFVAPREANQPWLDSALKRVEELVEELEAAGVPRERIVLGGFSQGACLALEAFARFGRGLGGVTAFAGGLIGERLDPAAYAEDLSGTPVLLGSADPDPHIPTGRVEESAELLRAKGARVDLRLYPGLGHAINEDELQAAREVVRAALGAA